MCCIPCLADTGVVFRFRSPSLEATWTALADLAKSCFGFSSELTLDWFLKTGGEPLGCFSGVGVGSSGVNVNLGLSESSSSPFSSMNGSS